MAMIYGNINNDYMDNVYTHTADEKVLKGNIT
jgi:hypothetical protein